MDRRLQDVALFIFLLAFPFYLTYELYFLDRVYFFCPVDYRQGELVIRSDTYGKGEFLARRNASRKHNGLDLQAEIGAPVYAAMGGRVVGAGFQNGLGNYVEIAHRLGYVTIYGHLSGVNVKENQRVRQADKIGEAGKTGNANYRGLMPHLHFEIRLNGVPLDPMGFLN